MGDFVEQLRLAEKAAEDIYFAKVSRELIESLHKQMQEEKQPCQAGAGARAEDSRLTNNLVQTATRAVSVREEEKC